MRTILAPSLLALSLMHGTALATLSSFRASNATAVSVTYGYPLVQYANVLSSVVALVGTNNLYHEQPGDIRPQNVDTLYSKAAIDLSQSDVILTVPKINDTRYFVVSFHGLWSGNFANVGRLRAADPGKYLLRIADQPGQVGFETPKEDDTSGYLGYINFPTIHGAVFSRIAAWSQPPSGSNSGATDVRAARTIQEAIQLAVAPRPGPRLGPSLTPELLGNGALERLAARAPGALGRHAVQERYAIRSLAVYTEYPRLAPSEALYPEWKADGAHEPALAARESYVLTFPSGKPPVEGFWSLSAFDAAGRLIPNALNRYSLGNRSNLTYSNGELVYGKTNRSDSFSILVQPADIIPPTNWTNNWLPAPAGGGRLALSLHLHGPTSSLKAGGSYKYPIVSKKAAISA